MTDSASDKSLKAQNLPWLVALATLDVIVLLVFLFPEAIGGQSLTALTAARAGITLLVPVVVLILAALISPNAKASLVFWRITNALPGHQAFSKYAADDPRIDMAALKKNIGEWPTDPRAQNALWYKQYLKVRSDKSIIEAHKAYLLFRDMAAFSIPLIVAVPCGLYANGAQWVAILASATWFIAQYALTAIPARHSGIGFVTSVLALHAAKRITASKAG